MVEAPSVDVAGGRGGRARGRAGLAGDVAGQAGDVAGGRTRAGRLLRSA